MRMSMNGRWSKDAVDEWQGQWLWQCVVAMWKPFFCHVNQDGKARTHKQQARQVSKLTCNWSFGGIRMARDEFSIIQGIYTWNKLCTCTCQSVIQDKKQRNRVQSKRKSHTGWKGFTGYILSYIEPPEYGCISREWDRRLWNHP
jgi:hypothetical protein